MLAKLEAGVGSRPAATELVEVSLVGVVDFGVERHKLDFKEIGAVVQRSIVGPSSSPDERKSSVTKRLSLTERLAIYLQIQVRVD